MEDLSSRLYYSVVDDNIDDLRRLIENGADVNQIFEDSDRISTKSILHIASEKGRLGCVKVLLENGASVNVRDPWGITPIRFCINADNEEIAELLITQDKESADSQDKYGKSVLHAAVEEGSEKFVKLFLRNGADVDITTDVGVTPLMTLMTTKGLDNYFVVMKILIDAGADIHAHDFRDKRTALHLAAITKKVDAVELLLSLNADPNELDKGLRTPLTNLMCHHISLRGRTITNIQDDVMTIVILLTQAGTDLNNNTTDFANPLIVAVYLKCSQLVRFFLDNGANVDLQLPFSGVTPLLIAVKQNDIDSIKALIDWNCRLDIVGRCRIRGDDYELDPFELAIDQAYWDIVEMLLLAGYNTSKHLYLRYFDSDADRPCSLKDNPDMLNVLRLTASIPHTLLKCCALAIYKALKSNISSKTDALPLPVSIRDYLKIQ